MAAAIFSALLISSIVTLHFLLSCQYPNMKVLLFALLCLRWRYCCPRALTGKLCASPFASWYTQTPFQPFFWLSSLRVAPSAVQMRLSGADCGRQCKCPTAFFLKEVTSLYLNCTVCFVLLRVPLLCIPQRVADYRMLSKSSPQLPFWALWPLPTVPAQLKIPERGETCMYMHNWLCMNMHILPLTAQNKTCTFQSLACTFQSLECTNLHASFIFSAKWEFYGVCITRYMVF